jgi:hypothetical protein
MGLAVGTLVVSAACRPTPTEPAPTAGVPLAPPGTGAPPPQPVAGLSPLLGTWRGVNTAFLPDIVQTTTWRFDADGACLETFLTITDGNQSESDRPCTWTGGASTVTVTYAGAGGLVTFTMQYSFPSRDVLRLDGDEFSRVT